MRRTVVAFADIYDVQDNSCYLGNVIVSPDCRGKGAAEFLIQVMSRIVKDELKLDCIQLICHNNNPRGLIFYKKQGFVPVDLIVNPPKSTGEYVVGIRLQKLLEKKEVLPLEHTKSRRP